MLHAASFASSLDSGPFELLRGKQQLTGERKQLSVKGKNHTEMIEKVCYR